MMSLIIGAVLVVVVALCSARMVRDMSEARSSLSVKNLQGIGQTTRPHKLEATTSLSFHCNGQMSWRCLRQGGGAHPRLACGSVDWPHSRDVPM